MGGDGTLDSLVKPENDKRGGRKELLFYQSIWLKLFLTDATSSIAINIFISFCIPAKVSAIPPEKFRVHG